MHNAGVAEGYSEEANALWLDFSRKSKKMQISTVVGILTSLKLNISSSNQSRSKPTLSKQNSQSLLETAPSTLLTTLPLNIKQCETISPPDEVVRQGARILSLKLSNLVGQLISLVFFRECILEICTEETNISRLGFNKRIDTIIVKG